MRSLFVTDEEMYLRLGLPEKVARAAIRELDHHARGLPFPAKDPLFGGRRFWPAVLQFFLVRYGVTPRTIDSSQTWEENFDAVSISPAGKAREPASPRPEMASPR